ncbi:MAG: aromatic acid exporter family protein [Streptococcus sp.]
MRILSITDTRRSTARLAYNRFMSMLLALFLGGLAFQILLGYNLWALGFYPGHLCSPRFSTRLGGKSASRQALSWLPHLLLEKSTSPFFIGK